MAVNITIAEYKVGDFISIDYGTNKISMTFFNGRVVTGGPGWVTPIDMTPEQAREVAQTLLRFADKLSPLHVELNRIVNEINDNKK